MYLYNTSFHLATAIEDDFINWVKQTYIPACIDFGFEKPLLLRVMTSVQPDCSAFAFQAVSENQSLIDAWENGPRMELIASMYKLWGENCMAFSTNMEVIEV